MKRYQQGDTAAVTALVECLTPRLYGFFASLTNSGADAEDMLEKHGFAFTAFGIPIAGPSPCSVAVCDRRSVPVKDHRRRRWLAWRKAGVGVFSDSSAREDKAGSMPAFEELVGRLPQDQREVLTMLKISGLSAEQVACATCSTARGSQTEAASSLRTLA